MTKTNSPKRSRKNRWVIPSVIALAIVLSAAGYYYYNKSQPVENNQTAIATSTISTGDIILTATGPGTLTPSKDVSFGFENRGRISEILVGLGDKVQAGQVLARQENTTLALEYKRNQASLEAMSSPSSIASAELNIQNAKEAFNTSRNNLQFLIGPDMLFAEEAVSDAQQKLEAATATAMKNPSDVNNKKVSDAKSALAKSQDVLIYVFNTYSSNYTLNTFTYPIRNDNGITLSKELIAPSDADILSAQAAYDLAKSNLNDAQNYLDVLQGNKKSTDVPASSITPITEAMTALNQAKADLDATELKAPISGTVTSINLNPGEYIGALAAVTISNTTQPYMVDAYLDETDWDKAKVGYDTSVTFDLLPDNHYPGKIVQVYPALDASSGTSLVHILVQLNNKIYIDLPAGATTSVDITGGRAFNAVLVPTSALKEVEPGKYVVYLIKDSKPVEQEVEIGLQDILNAEVKTGLKTGDVVLTNATPVNQ